MEFSKRIQAIVDAIAYPTLADTGTDHGYIPILAMKQGKITRAVACDINAAPLVKAKENVLKYGLEDKISLVLADGFQAVSPGAAETGIAAGMGGLLTIDIIDRARETVDSFRQLILQPQSHIADVRRKVHAISFSIVDEIIVEDQGKYYFIIDARKGPEPPYHSHEYILGRKLPEKKDPLFLRYVHIQQEKRLEIIKGIEGQGDSFSLSTMATLEEHYVLLDLYKEVLNGEG